MGEGCAAAADVLGFSLTPAEGQAYASEDGTVLVAPFTPRGGAFGLSLLLPVPIDGGIVTLAGATGVSDQGAPASAEIPADAAQGLVLDAPGTPADGVEVYPYPVL